MDASCCLFHEIDASAGFLSFCRLSKFIIQARLNRPTSTYHYTPVVRKVQIVGTSKYLSGDPQQDTYTTIYYDFLCFSDIALHAWTMLLFRQEAFLLFLACEYFAIKGGSSQEITGKFCHYFLRYNIESQAAQHSLCKLNVIVHSGIVQVSKHLEISCHQFVLP